ncbi:MAG: hypothetical protein KatS3mg060_2549 [Dehalococcoidia bacterium]|nr:MAG: hypothetical protein KatS3mg060_2549 [Dehalococcoidia bacterium]
MLVPVHTVPSGTGDEEAIASAADWIAARTEPATPLPPVEVVEVWATDGALLTGYLWGPPGATDVVAYVYGMGTVALRAFAGTQAPVYAAEGVATLALDLRRAGRGGLAVSTPANDVDDIDAWVRFLAGRGFRRIITAGHSLGSIGVTLQQVRAPHPNVVANVHFAPTEDCPPWARRGLGNERYTEVVGEARRAVAEGRGQTALVDADYRVPEPDQYRHPARHFQRAESWLAWWGPEGPVHSEEIGKVSVPILLLAGSDDTFNTPARMDLLKARAVSSPAVATRWYTGCNHAFDGFERQTARDVIAWARQVGALG